MRSAKMSVINLIVEGLRSEGLNEAQIRSELTEFDNNPPEEVLDLIEFLKETVNG
jgi:hypothetical protein